MVGDFDEFLKMPGCRKGKHKFVEVKKAGSSKVRSGEGRGESERNVTVTLG